MKKYKSRFLGFLLVSLGILALAIWFYARSDNSSTHVAQGVVTSSISRVVREEPINPVLTMGVVTLSVENLDTMTEFYHQTVGLDLISRSGSVSEIGKNGSVFLRLSEEKGLQFPSQSDAGLYHTAILYKSRKDLANGVYNILTQARERYSGSSDHSVSEAFYFSDPEGNSLELYYDRPRSEWKYNQEGKPTMGSTAIDTEAYIVRYMNLPVSSSTIGMGHIHLKVGDISRAKKFYNEILLFEEIADMGSALFISRDGYHHHLGMNVWESAGAEMRPKNTYGLKSFELKYSMDIYQEIRQNLIASGVAYIEGTNTITLDDPWGNTIKISQF